MSDQVTMAESLAEKAQRMVDAHEAMERLFPGLSGPGLTSDMSDVAYALLSLLSASENIQAIRKEKEEMPVKYPDGTCNAEDAWRDFEKEEERVWRNFTKAIQEINTKR